MSVCLYVCLFVCLSACMYLCLYVCRSQCQNCRYIDSLKKFRINSLKIIHNPDSQIVSELGRVVHLEVQAIHNQATEEQDEDNAVNDEGSNIHL